jgi:DNA-binding beta-propeller fold protein YncE
MNRTLITILLPAALFAAGAYSPEKAVSVKKAKSNTPKFGITTPGVQLPFSSVKFEAELPTPAKPAWVFVSDAAFFPAGDHIDKIDLKTNKVESIGNLDKACGGMVSGFDSLWVPLCGSSSLARLDSKTFKITKTIATGVSSTLGVIAASTDSVWMLTDDKTTLARIDPDQNVVVAEVRVPSGCRSLTFGETAIWLACPARDRVLRINVATNLVEKQIEVSAEPESIAVGESSIWVLCRKDGKIDRIDPKTNKVTKTVDLHVPNVGGSIAFGEGYLWAGMPGFPLARIEIQNDTVTVAQQFFGEGGGAFAIGSGAIWMPDVGRNKVVRIDPKRVRAILPE